MDWYYNDKKFISYCGFSPYLKDVEIETEKFIKNDYTFEYQSLFDHIGN
jgi:hypothetical protein